jgi:hypothetical protein
MALRPIPEWVLCCTLIFVLADHAEANRPFVTDDAAIYDQGQVGIETWLETAREEEGWVPAYGLEIAVVPTEWLELNAAGVIGRDPAGTITLSNPQVEAKTLFWQPVDNGLPGVALAAGYYFKAGKGVLFTDEPSAYVLVPVTASFADGDVVVHGNLGVLASWTENWRTRPQWGLGVEVPFFLTDTQFIAEVFSGDIDEAETPTGVQVGAKWEVGEVAVLDFGVMVASHAEDARNAHSHRHLEWTVHFGLTYAFDVFTPGGRKGDPDGAPGLFPRMGR